MGSSLWLPALAVKVTFLLSLGWILAWLTARGNPRWNVWLWRSLVVALPVTCLLSLWSGPLYWQVLEIKSDNHLLEIDEQKPVTLQTKKTLVQTLTSSERNSWMKSLEDDNPATEPGRQQRPPQSITRSAYPPTLFDVHRQPSSDIADLSTQRTVASANDPAIPSGDDSEQVIDRRSVWIWIVAFWLCGVMFQAAFWLTGEYQVIRLLSQGVSAEEWIIDECRSLARRLNVPMPRLIVCPAFGTPSLAGWRRKWLILPCDLVQPSNSPTDLANLRAALAHELSHIQGNDLFWDRCLRLTAILLWVHPLAWRVPLAHRRACETVCDLNAADLLQDRRAYRASLARMALQVCRLPAAGVMAMAAESEILRRLKRLAGDCSAPPLRHRLLTTAATVALIVIIATAQFVKQDPEPIQSDLVMVAVGRSQVAKQIFPEELLTGRVLNSDGQPVDRAAIRILARPASSWNFATRVRSVQTDKAGRFRISTADTGKDAVLAVGHNQGGQLLLLSSIMSGIDIPLKQSAHLSVTVMDGPNPAADVLVSAGTLLESASERQGLVLIEEKFGTTDQAGVVEFDNLLPESTLIRRVWRRKLHVSNSYDEQQLILHLSPGTNPPIQLINRQTVVKGSVQIPAALRTHDTPAASQTIYLSEVPESPENIQRRYLASTGAGGEFQFFGVRPGNYRLRSPLTVRREAGTVDPALKRSQPPRFGQSVTIGEAATTFSVRESPGQTINLGTLTAELTPLPDRGTMAPHFVGFDLDDNLHRLSNFLGRIVLLHFWDSTNDQSQLQLLQLKQLVSEYPEDYKFAVVGINLDHDPESARRFALARGIHWTQLVDGPVQTIANSFRVTSLSEMFVLDETGRILMRTNQVDDVRLAVQNAIVSAASASQKNVETNGSRSQSINDSDFHSAHSVSIAVLQPKSSAPAGGTADTSSHCGLTLFDQSGTVVRSIGDVHTEISYLAERIAVDADRGRLYVCDTDSDRLLAVGRDGRQQFEMYLPNLLAAAVDRVTGDIWCACHRGNISTRSIVVLDSDGHVKRRHDMDAVAIRYSAAADAFWIAAKDLRLINRDGTERARFSNESTADLSDSPEESRFTAVATDADGGCWAVQSTTERTAVVHTRRSLLWHVDKDATVQARPDPSQSPSLMLIASDGHSLPTSYGELPRWLEFFGDELWAGFINYAQPGTELQDFPRTTFSIRRFAADGTVLGGLPINSLSATSTPDGQYLWVHTNEGLSRFDRSGTVVERIGLKPSDDHPGQRTWIGAF